MPKRKIYIIDTVSSFRMRYVVEAESLEHAYDEVTMKDSGAEEDAFNELSQRHLGEQIIDGRTISLKDLKRLISEMEKDSKELCIASTNLDYYIRKIKYDN
jgi:hypothetical protein